MKKIVEAFLFTAHSPISTSEIHEVLEEVEPRNIREAVVELQEEYDRGESGIRIVRIANGFQICTRPELSSWLKKFHQIGSRQKLSKPALETLAIIAYRQPIVRSEIEAIRGVGVDYVLKTLLEKSLIRIMGRKKVVGAPLIYGTTEEFLRYFGLASLSELPEVEELEVKNESAGIQKEDR